MKRSVIVSLALVLLSHGALAGDAGCKYNRRLIGKCYTMRGIVMVSADIGPVVGSDDEKTRLIIRAAPDSEKDMPLSIDKVLSDDFQAEIHGVYEVCPIPTEPSQFPPGITHYACIEKASELTVTHWKDPHKTSK